MISKEDLDLQITKILKPYFANKYPINVTLANIIKLNLLDCLEQAHVQNPNVYHKTFMIDISVSTDPMPIIGIHVYQYNALENVDIYYFEVSY